MGQQLRGIAADLFVGIGSAALYLIGNNRPNIAALGIRLDDVDRLLEKEPSLQQLTSPTGANLKRFVWTAFAGVILDKRAPTVVSAPACLIALADYDLDTPVLRLTHPRTGRHQ